MPGKLSVVGCAVPPVSVVPLGSVARDDGVRKGASSVSGSGDVSAVSMYLERQRECLKRFLECQLRVR